MPTSMMLGILAENMAIDLNMQEEYALQVVCYLLSEQAITPSSLFQYMMKEEEIVDRLEAEGYQFALFDEGWGGDCDNT